MNKYIICYAKDDNIYYEEFDEAEKAAAFLESNEFKSILINVVPEPCRSCAAPTVTIEDHT